MEMIRESIHANPNFKNLTYDFTGDFTLVSGSATIE